MREASGRAVMGSILAGALSFGLVACGGGGSSSTPAPPCPPAAGPPTTVSIVNDSSTIGAYQPKDVTVARCASITWTDDSDTPHTVTFTSGKVKSSGTFSKGQSYTVTVARTGTFRYFCTLHPLMKGSVTAS